MTVQVRYLECTVGSHSKFWACWTGDDWCAVHFGRRGTVGQWRIYPQQRARDLSIDTVWEKFNKGYELIFEATDLPVDARPAGPVEASAALQQAMTDFVDSGSGRWQLCAFAKHTRLLAVRPWLAFLHDFPHQVNDRGVLLVALPEDRIEWVDELGALLEAAHPVQDIPDDEELRVLAGLIDESVHSDELSRLAQAAKALV